MTSVCVVKQNTTYDLFTRTGPDLRTIVASSNWRSGPIGLWEAFDTTARIVFEDAAPECQAGKRQWSRYVEGWELWPADGAADVAEDVDWSQYDIVISIDVAVPSRIVRRFPRVLWCYYFIEGGPWGIDRQFRGSPYYGYNVFLNHRMARTLLSPHSPSWRQMKNSRRAVLDFPYYMQSAHSVRYLYQGSKPAPRSGVCLSHHSRDVLTEADRAALATFGPVRTQWSSIADIHSAEVASSYFVVHPASRPTAGVALIEAVSAGCIVLAPRDRVRGFPELLTPELDFSSMEGLLDHIRRLEDDRTFLARCQAQQERKVDEWCYSNAARNLEGMLHAFRASTASPHKQRRAEMRAKVGAQVLLAALGVARRARNALAGTRGCDQVVGRSRQDS